MSTIYKAIVHGLGEPTASGSAVSPASCPTCPACCPGYVALGAFFQHLETKHTAPDEEVAE